MKRLALLIALSLAGASAAESPAVVDANGAILGSYIGSTGPRSSGQAMPVTSMLDVVSSTGYLFSIFQQSGDVAGSFRIPGVQAQALPATLFFESTDCTGQAYVDTTQSPDVVVMGGFVFNRKSAVDPGLWFSPKTSVSTEISYGSAVGPNLGNVCSAESGQRNALPVYPNDPQVTGVNSASNPGPITISQANVPRVLFRDSFEQRQVS